ncbi:MAG: hypothetical protein AAGG68_25865 [Bacteroidota bacterium]
MAYKDFKFIDLQKQFGIRQTSGKLFKQKVPLVEPSAHLLRTLELAKEFPLTTEKAVSEALVFPILQELKINNRKTVELFSGEKLVADKTLGLTGECDFIFAKAPGSKELIAPIINITEAKRGDIDNPRSLSQSAAQLIGARLFNQKNDTPVEPIYGACTSGHEWIFMRLKAKSILIDTHRYSTANLATLLGVIQHIIDLNLQLSFSKNSIVDN